MSERNYWTSAAIGRRSALRTAGVTVAGVAGAAFIGCRSSETTEEGSAGGDLNRAVTGGTPVGNTTSNDQVRVSPGFYEVNIPASIAEQDPRTHGRRGGTLTGRYLDTSTLDANRIMGCETVNTTNLTHSKLVRAKVGAMAHPLLPEIEPDLAESWEASPDSTEFVFHLREGVKTHNVDPVFGRDYTAEDVSLTFQRYQAGGVQQGVFAAVTSMEVQDDHTLKITLDQPISDFPTELAAWSVLEVKEMLATPDRLSEESVGTGPFIMERWIKKERVDLRGHPDYWEEGLPFFDRVENFIQTDAAALRAGFLTNNFFDWSARDLADAEEMAKQVEDMLYVTLPRSRGANVNGFHFQMENTELQDIRVRRAISLAFDPNEYDIAQNAGDNQNPDGAFSNPPMPWSYMYDDYPTQKANGPWYQFDPEQASQLMQAAGYTTAAPLEFELVTYFSRSQMANLVVPAINEQLPEVRINFREVDDPTHMQVLVDRNFVGASGIVWGPPGYAMDQWIYPWWHSKGALNYNNVVDADMDRMLEEQRAETNPEAKRAIWQQVWDRIHDQVWEIWWPESLIRSAHHNYVMNFRTHGFMGGYSCYTSDQARAMWFDEGSPMG